MFKTLKHNIKLTATSFYPKEYIVYIISAPEPVVTQKVEVKKSVYVPPAHRNNFQGELFEV